MCTTRVVDQAAIGLEGTTTQHANDTEGIRYEHYSKSFGRFFFC